MSAQVVQTLAEFPIRPTKGELLDSFFRVLEDVRTVYDAINTGPDTLVIDQETAFTLALSCARLDALKSVLGTISYLEQKRENNRPKLIVP